MALVPRRLSDKVQFFHVLLVSLDAHAAAVGLTPAEVAALRTRADQARAAFTDQQTAADAARSATLRFNLALDALVALGQTTIGQVRAFARTTGDPAVLSLATLPPVARPSPVGKPGEPYQPATRLDGGGSLILTWSCRNPGNARGTVYQVRRRVGGAGAYEHLGTVGKKRFVDATIPAGATAIEYEVQAVRSTSTGPIARFNVNFGTNGFAASPPIMLAA